MQACVYAQMVRSMIISAIFKAMICICAVFRRKCFIETVF